MKILILCTGNSCRSQMAEAYCRHYTPSDYSIYSAGIEKHGLNPYMLKVMAEENIDMSLHHSKSIDELPRHPWNLIITVCDHARESCPYLPSKEKLHTPFPDPPQLVRDSISPLDENQILSIYRDVRDQINLYFKTLF